MQPMARTSVSARLAFAAAVLFTAGCGAGRPAVRVAPLPHSAADVRFVSGMIPHHAQAVLMAGWAATHDASSSVRILCERIVVAQSDEIAFLQRWLGDRGLPVPPADASHDMMPGMTRELMPGMLTAEQLQQLGRARGVEFDRLFMRFMIIHHEGAITMVDQLFGSQGAAQDEYIFKFATDVHADQTTEIERMTRMLEALPAGDRNP